MIPVTLRLRDFLSYADPDPLDFTGFEVACLTGANGQGKSSLLDAMTWALFGAARGCEGGQHQDRLIREGAETASVELTFELAEQTYRIHRARSRSGKADLRFEVQDGSLWTNLAAETLRETEERIASVLRMDYRTFTASAFFLQGRADDFLARMKPEDRKEVFARLLDLGVYERLEDAARARARDAERTRQAHAARIEELGTELADLGGIEEELASAESAASNAADALAEAKERLEKRWEEVSRLERVEAVVDRERSALDEICERLDADRASLEAKEHEIRELDELLARREEVREALDEAVRLREAEERARRSAERSAALERTLAELRGRIDAEERALRSRLEERGGRARALAGEIAALTSDEARLAEVAEQLVSGAELGAVLDDLRGQLDELRGQDAEFRHRMGDLESRRTETGEKLALVERGEGECWVCGNALDDAHRRRLRRELSAEVDGLAKRFEQARTALEGVRKEGKRLKEEAVRLERSVEELQTLRSQEAALRAKLERLPELRTELEALEAELAEDRRCLEEGSYAAELRAQAEQVAVEIRGVAYDPDAHTALQERLEALRAFEQLHGQIEQAGSVRERAVGERDALAVRIAEAERDHGERRARLAEEAKTLDGLADARAKVDEARGLVEACATAERQAATRQATLAERRDRLRQRAEESEAARRSEQAAAAEHRRYARLTQAFGRGGIPDRIIDNALPELTAEANDILGRLSDHEMSLQFMLTRQTKAGKVRETFDVLVHHEGGLRDYQMFSGGEAFRVAFAIRLGLSKLLVRRAGARLETLVVDEGFGTQDPEGRERLVEAINLARREFRKVLVITHLEELKDAFGAQIRVAKDPVRGSELEILSA